jgi:hypothetical protein
MRSTVLNSNRAAVQGAQDANAGGHSGSRLVCFSFERQPCPTAPFAPTATATEGEGKLA